MNSQHLHGTRLSSPTIRSKCSTERIARKPGKQGVYIDRFEPTSKVCSKGGHRQDMPLRERVFKCGDCGLEMDRDRMRLEI
ncbi:MAG: transposase [Chloroflexi bacterium]|nr:transposase [Chloroflexota bacterium]MXX52160.1 transposase [Chloroflexota bacterium]MXX83135.1 transposase [Chloroflexota bacterium]MYA92166.1 transposase [Chloroflexota bacterium]MYC54024.1 transposase [Chloroflexota bacterium]